MKDEKINEVINRLSDLEYPLRPHGIPTGIFHDAVEVILYLRSELRKRDNGKDAQDA